MDYKQTQSLTSFVAISAYVAAIVLISGQFNELVPEPYMVCVFGSMYHLEAHLF